MKYTFTALALAALSLASPVPEAASAAPSSFKITSVIHGGSGCPQGSIDVDYTDNKILPIRFGKDFVVSQGPGVSIEETRKFCQINLSLSFSPGFQYTVYHADFDGYGKLDAGVKGTVRSKYYWSGETDQVVSSTDIVGPFTGRYTKSDDVAAAVWSPCGGGGLFNVAAEILLSGKGSGTLATTKETGKFTNSIYIKWREC